MSEVDKRWPQFAQLNRPPHSGHRFQLPLTGEQQPGQLARANVVSHTGHICQCAWTFSSHSGLFKFILSVGFIVIHMFFHEAD
jgi:hypothetical protein